MADPRILLLAPDGSEKQSLLSALESRLEFRTRTRLPKELSAVDLLWIHRGPEEAEEPLASDEYDLVRTWVENGGRLLLTGSPAAWTGRLGIEDRPPELRDARWHGPVRQEERLGLAPFLSHPLFERFPGGLYLRRPRPGTRIVGAWYEDGIRPVQGRLLAVEKVHLGINARRGLLIEHQPGEGRVLSLGAHLVFSDPVESDSFREARLRFVGDLIDDLLSAGQEIRGRAWPLPMDRNASWKLSDEILDQIEESTPLGLDRFEREGLRLEPASDTTSYYDLVGKRGDLLIGEAGRGPSELWHLPLRIFRDHSLVIDGETGSLGSWSLWPSATMRHVEGGDRVIQEYWTVGIEETGAACSYRLTEGEKARIEIAFTCDHRLLWPYPAGALGCLVVRRDDAGRRIEIEDESGVGLLGISWSRMPQSCTIEDAGGDGGARIRFEFELDRATGNDQVEGIFVAGLDAEGTRRRMHAMASGESDLVAEVLVESRARQDRGFQIDLGDGELNEEISWIRAKGRDFFQQTEHLWEEEECAGYVAGFQATQPGWCSGRPGLAWYFGRDGAWTAARNLVWGDRDEAAAQLRLLARFLGPDGQILEELTPSGTIHYEALDATPMFISLLESHLAWSGDLDLVQELFPVVEKALHGQLLPHSANVGSLRADRSEHAWIEDGPLREDLGADLSLACLEADALAAAARMAARLDRDELARRLQKAATEAAAVLSERFKDPESGVHRTSLAVDGDGSTELTALSLLPFLHGLEGRAGGELAALSLERHSADWGQRLLDSTHPAFDPTAYQGGSVWPLVSAWVTIADFASGRSEQAWARLRGQLSLVRHFAPGVVEEAYAGDRFVPAGVCAHQAWSHAALLSMLAEGLLGLGIAEDGEALRLRPSLPMALPEITFRGLPYRELILDGRIRRNENGLILELQVGGLGDGQLDLGALFPLPCRAGGARLNGKEIVIEATSLDESLLIRADRLLIRAGQELELRIEMETDLELELPLLMPVPGQASRKARLLSRTIPKDGSEAVRLLVEGPAGREAWPLRLGTRVLHSVEGAEIRGEQLHFELDADGSGYGSKEIQLQFAPPGEPGC